MVTVDAELFFDVASGALVLALCDVGK